MRIVVQRVSRACVRVDGAATGEIGPGLVLLVGVHRNDLESPPQEWTNLARKCADLRIFQDQEGKMNLSARQQGFGALVISQFTLYGDCRKGTRPNFMDAAPGDRAKFIYDSFVDALRQELAPVATGTFGAMMEVELVNHGPVTVLLESRS